MQELSRRRAETAERLSDLKKGLTRAEELLQGKACVYATGSFGRHEASSFSDLDLFIVGRRNGRPSKSGSEGSALRKLDEIRIKADLIDATKQRGIPDFDGDGRYLAHYSIDELTRTLGSPEDDASNTFTARLLLLLESTPIVGAEVYDDTIDDVIAAYWGDYEKHKDSFVPSFLANDILRLWRTLCVNYEARTEREPEQKRIKKKVKNFKLKCSRMLTCFSAILFLLSHLEKLGSVSPEDASEMTRLTPIARLQRIQADVAGTEAATIIDGLLANYDEFLSQSNFSEEEMFERFRDREISRAALQNAEALGDGMAKAIAEIGKNSRFYRMLLV